MRLPDGLAALALLALGACDAPPVEWQDARRLPPAADSITPGGAGRRLTLAATGNPTLVAAPALAAPDDATHSGTACAGSLRVAAGKGATRFAAWWSVRPDSSAVILASVSTDSGASWRTQPVDTLDRGVRGCDRPAAALAADSVNGYAHVTYFLEAPEGPGLFYSHLMDPRARFEPPAVIVYGTRPVASDIASEGELVVVAYEDPNRARPQVELALSRSGGHLFEERHVDVSGEDVAAYTPRVAVARGRVAVMWGERTGDGGAGNTWVVRTGSLR